VREKLLLHVCCGPCAIIPAAALAEKFDVTGFWFNPNIHPRAEYEKRLQTAGYAFGRLGLSLEYDLSYDIASWFSSALAADTRKNRCRVCYAFRLSVAAKRAAAEGFQVFSTTMSQSPYQDFDAIAAAGADAARSAGLRFFIEDFRPRYREGKKRALEWGMYRQNYCGCLFSELERRGIDGTKFPER